MFRKYSRRLAFQKLMVLLLTISFLTLNLSEQSIVSAASKPDTSKQVELKWFVVGSGQQADTKMVEKEVNKYLKDKINAILKLTTLTWGEDFENKMAVKVASGEAYDITFTSNWAMNYREYAKAGAFVDITDMMDTYAPKTKALLGKKILESVEVDGKVYALPVYNSEIVNDYGILLNNTLVKKYKIDTSKIKKLNDLEATFKKIKAREPNIINFYPFDEYGSDGIYNILNYDKLYDRKLPGAVLRDGKSTKVINYFDTREAKSLFNLMNKWYKSGYINEYTEADNSYFDNNNSNIFAFYSKLYPNKCEELLQSKHLDLVPISLTKPTLSTNSSMQAISFTSKNPERALMFLELVNTDEKLSNMLNYGIEGVHYKKTGSNSISQLSPRYEKYNPSTSWMFGNQSIAYSLPGYSALSENKLKEYVNKAIVSPLLEFSFDSEPVLSQIVDLRTVTYKYLIDLCIGKVNPSVYLPKMNKELKKAGLQKVLDEMQSQVNEFVEDDNQ